MPVEKPGQQKKAARKKAEQGIWKSYVRLIFKAKLPWIWLVGLTILNVIDMTLSLMMPQYAQKIAEGVLTNSVIFGLVATILIRVLMSGIIRYMGKLTMYKVDISYRKLIWRRLLHSPMSLFDRVKPNEMVSRTANDTATISGIVAGVLPSLVGLIYSAIMIFTILAGYDWRLTLAFAVYTPVYIMAYIFYGKWNYRTNKQTHNRLASLTQFLSELLVNVPLIKSFAREHREDERGREQLQVYYKASMRRALVNWFSTPLVTFLNLIADLFVIVFGIYLVAAGTITIGAWIGFFMYVGMYIGILETASSTYLQIKQSQGATSRIAKLIEGELEVYEGGKRLVEDNHDIEFKHVSFAYEEAKPILKDISFSIPYGKTTAIIGPSGSGKSTVLSLIERLYQPSEGEILFGQENSLEYNLQDWRARFSYVAQDTALFDGTIRDNIEYGANREVSEFELNEAAKAANALSFIQDSEAGYETQVGEGGSNLSGGQRQRVAIARAMLRDTNFLLLDEALSNLDGQSEQAVQQAIDQLKEGRTTIMVTHDLAAIRNADQIILLQDGEIDHVGTHETLLAESSLYQQYIRLLSESPAG